MEQKIFDDFPKVDCNECEHYYTNACDGVSKSSERVCKEFLATRRVDIPEEISRLRKQIKAITRSTIIIAISVLILYLNFKFGW